jgi:ribose transport system substrate-binding protein
MRSQSLLAVALGGLSGIALAAFPVLRPASRLPEISFIPRTSGTLPTEAMHRGANRAAQEAGFRLYWNAPTREDDVDRQVLLLSNALHDNTKGLILAPTNGLALISKINEFVGRRVPVVVVQTDTPIPPGPYISSVAPDQNQMGRLAAERILSVLDADGEVAVVGLDRTAPETLQRARAFVSSASGHAAIKLVAQQYGTSFVPEAEQNAGEVLDRFPDLKALFAVSATATEGASLAIQRRGLGHKVLLVGCDDYLYLVSDLRAGKVDSVVVPDNDQMGYLAAKSLLAAIQGRALSPPQYIAARLLTRDRASSQNSR